MAVEHTTNGSPDRDVVMERLEALRENYTTVERVAKYVESAHDTQASTSDFLNAIRLDESLALELRTSTGRTVIAALADNSGEVRYCTWTHSAIGAQTDGTPRVRSVEHRRDVVDTLEGRSPLVRPREDTPLEGIEAPDSWRGNQEVFAGP